MRIFLLIVLSLIFAAVITSCEKENFPELPAANPNDTVRFSTDVEPLLNSGCTASGCHNGSYAPNLLTGKSYAALLDGSYYVDTLLKKTDGSIDADASRLMIRMNKDMPPGNLFSKGDIDKVRNWIVQGAREN